MRQPLARAPVNRRVCPSVPVCVAAAKPGFIGGISTENAAFITKELFANLPICNESKKAIREVLKYDTLTSVQAMSLPPILEGKDCLAKAKTGERRLCFTRLWAIPPPQSSSLPHAHYTPRCGPRVHVGHSSYSVLSPCT